MRNLLSYSALAGACISSIGDKVRKDNELSVSNGWSRQEGGGVRVGESKKII